VLRTFRVVQTMSGLDASFLYFETASMHMHVCAALLLDPSTAPTEWSTDRVCDTFRERLPLIEPFRRRVHQPSLRLTHPSWVEVDVDVDDHVHVLTCPAPGGTAEFEAVVADFAGRRLDRSRPLWEALVVEGLADDRVGVVLKVHHCAVDGVAAANVLIHLFDLSPKGRSDDELDVPERVEPSTPGMVRRLATTTTALAGRPVAVARLVPSAVRAVAGVVRQQAAGAASGAPVPFAAPRVPFNGGITPGRVVALVDVALDDVKAARRGSEATFNDVVLAVCGGAFRRYLLDRDELPSASLLAVCPVNVRVSDSETGNRTSAILASLATDVEDPASRREVVHAATAAAKAQHEAVGGGLLAQSAEVTSPSVTTLAARAYSAVRLADLHPAPANVVLSTLPGPPMQIYLAGAAVEAIHPLGPVLEGFGLNVTVASYRDRVGFGFIACARRMPDVADLAAAVPAALEELLAATS
jgi:diacylglycerol O-acyltransferase